jgi:dTMP kinase
MFITFEGIEGSGKTTQICHAADFLERKGFSVRQTREPGGTEIGTRIRSILLDPESRMLSHMTELLLYTADRCQHLQQVVLPEIAAGKLVLCDRYFDATVAYQGTARGLDADLIRKLHQLVNDGFRPDLTLLLDLSPQTGLSRAWRQINNGDRNADETRFEKERLAFHRRVREGYLGLAAAEPDRFRIIDAEQDEETVCETIRILLDRQVVQSGSRPA